MPRLVFPRKHSFHKYLVEDAEFFHEVPQLFSKLDGGQGPVGAQGADKSDLLLGDSAGQKLLDHQGSDLTGLGGPGHIVEDDHG